MSAIRRFGGAANLAPRQVPADALLPQPRAHAETVDANIPGKQLFDRIEVFDGFGGVRQGFGHPQFAVRQQHRFVHQQRAYLRKMAAQTAKGCKAMGVHIDLVVH